MHKRPLESAPAVAGPKRGKPFLTGREVRGKNGTGCIVE